MAQRFDAVATQARLFKQRPDKTVTITLDDGDHTWTVKNGGGFIKKETIRLVSELQALSSTKASVDTANDEGARNEFATAAKTAIDRYRSAFNAQITSEDESASKWLDETLMALDLDVLAVTVIELVTSLQGEA